MVKINLQDFKPVKIRAKGLVLESGGHLRKEYPLHTKDVKLEGSLSVATFVWISANHPWLTQSIMGKSRWTGLMCQDVLKDLRYKVASAEQRLRWELEGVSRGWCHPGDRGVDPMDEMEVETPACTSDKKMKKSMGKLPFISRVCRIAMNEWLPEMTPDSPNIERMVSVYLEGAW